MNLITLAEAREELWEKGGITGPSNYSDANESQIEAWNRRFNRVIQRFFERIRPARAYRRVDVPIYDDAITLPREVESLLGVKILDENECAGSPLFIYSRFHEFAESGRWTNLAPIASPVTEMAQTFRDPAAGFRLRIKATIANGGKYKFFGGTDEDDAAYHDSVELDITNGTSTTTRVWNTLPRMLKPITTAAIEVYSVDADDEETLISIHAPGDTSPAWQRYSLPSCGDATTARVLTKLCYVRLAADTDIVIPSSFGALQLGLQALRYEDVNDWDNAAAAWNGALELIDSGKQQLEGEAEIPSFRSVPGFGCDGIPQLI